MVAAVPSLLYLDTIPHNRRVAPPVGIRGPASRVALQIVLVHIRASDEIHFTGLPLLAHVVRQPPIAVSNLMAPIVINIVKAVCRQNDKASLSAILKRYVAAASVGILVVKAIKPLVIFPFGRSNGISVSLDVRLRAI